MHSSRQSKKRNTSMPEKTLAELRKIAAKKAENPHTNNDLRIKLLRKGFEKTLTNRASSLPPNTIVNSFDKKKKNHTTRHKKNHTTRHKNEFLDKIFLLLKKFLK